jgi:hypothetical protein
MRVRCASPSLPPPPPPAPGDAGDRQLAPLGLLAPPPHHHHLGNPRPSRHAWHTDGLSPIAQNPIRERDPDLDPRGHTPAHLLKKAICVEPLQPWQHCLAISTKVHTIDRRTAWEVLVVCDHEALVKKKCLGADVIVDVIPG